MPKRKNAERDDDELLPEEAQRRVDGAVKRPLSRKPETHEMVRRSKHRKGEIEPKPKSPKIGPHKSRKRLSSSGKASDDEVAS